MTQKGTKYYITTKHKITYITREKKKTKIYRLSQTVTFSLSGLEMMKTFKKHFHRTMQKASKRLHADDDRICCVSKGVFWVNPAQYNEYVSFLVVPLHHPEFGLGRIHPNILVVCSRFEGEKDCPPHKTKRFSKESCLIRGRRMANPCQSSLEALGGLTSLQ